MSYQKKFQFIWLTGLEVTATVNFDNLQRQQRHRERDCHILTRTSLQLGRVKTWRKTANSAFTKKHFLTTWPLGGSKKMYHVKFKNKISYLGKKISILPWQMAEQLAVEVDVKNVTQQQQQQQDKLIYFVWIVTWKWTLFKAKIAIYLFKWLRNWQWKLM